MSKKETITSTIEKYGLDLKARGHNLTVYFNDTTKKLLSIGNKDIKNITFREPDSDKRKKLKLEIIQQLDNIARSKTENSIKSKLVKLFKIMKSEEALINEKNKAVDKSIKRRKKKEVKKVSKNAASLIDELEGLDLSTSDIERLNKLSKKDEKLTNQIKSSHGRSASGEY